MMKQSYHNVKKLFETTKKKKETHLSPSGNRPKRITSTRCITHTLFNSVGVANE